MNLRVSNPPAVDLAPILRILYKRCWLILAGGILFALSALIWNLFYGGEHFRNTLEIRIGRIYEWVGIPGNFYGYIEDPLSFAAFVQSEKFRQQVAKRANLANPGSFEAVARVRRTKTNDFSPTVKLMIHIRQPSNSRRTIEAVSESVKELVLRRHHQVFDIVKKHYLARKQELQNRLPSLESRIAYLEELSNILRKDDSNVLIDMFDDEQDLSQIGLRLDSLYEERQNLEESLRNFRAFESFNSYRTKVYFNADGIELVSEPFTALPLLSSGVAGLILFGFAVVCWEEIRRFRRS